ncbi:PH domain-containing protein [Metabacillus indicus]|uniref:PH domain-containing protein n=1 Tax=Metabacillus indicus TaxID=246786 RepID=UPI00317409C5
MKFKVKRNPILVCIIVFLILFPFFLLYQGEPAAPIVFPFLIAAFLAHALFNSYFVIADQKLKIVFGLIRKEIFIRDMKEVHYSMNPLSSPAWTFKRLKIVYTGSFSSSRPAYSKFALVSLPKDEKRFFRELTMINPGISTPI